MKAFAKDYLFGLTVLTLTCLLAIFSYYILVNTVFLDTALPSVKAQNYSVGMKKEEEIKETVPIDDRNGITKDFIDATNEENWDNTSNL